MFKVGEWIIDLMGDVGIITEVKTLDRYELVIPRTRKMIVRFESELTHAPMETLYNDYNIHFLQTLAVNTGDREWFENLSEKLGVKK
jgi:hypothetical protein